VLVELKLPISLLLIAADDDIMPQTKGNFSAQAAGVPIIFAIKVDKPNAIQKIKVSRYEFTCRRLGW
jgi:translation initiation factor IF-2